MAFRFIQTSDWHLGVKLSSLPSPIADLRRTSALRTISQMISESGGENLDAAVLPGDLFDNHKPSNAVKNSLLDILRRLPSNTKVYIVPGTHDYYYEGGIWDNPEFSKFHIFKSEGFSFFDHPNSNIRVWGVPVLKGNRDKNWFESLPQLDKSKVNILLFHGDFRGTGREYDEWDYPFDLYDITNSGFSYVALGHHHKSRMIETNGKVLAAYTGSPCGWSFRKSELGSRNYIIGTISDSDVKITVQEVSGPMIHNFEIDVSNFTDAKTTIESIQSVNLKDFIRIIISGNEDPLNLKSEIEKLRNRYTELMIEDRSDMSSQIEPEDNIHLDKLIKQLDRMLVESEISREFHARLVNRAKMIFK